jgi:hypothetical protein
MPREWLETPSSFGKERQPSWRPVAPDKKADVVTQRAAQVHHACVVVIRAELKRRRWSWPHLASQLHTIDEVQLGRIKRGEAHLSMRVIVDVSALLGPVLLSATRIQPIHVADHLVDQEDRRDIQVLRPEEDGERDERSEALASLLCTALCPDR